jgi:hypothetical protein
MSLKIATVDFRVESDNKNCNKCLVLQAELLKRMQIYLVAYFSYAISPIHTFTFVLPM